MHQGILMDVMKKRRVPRSTVNVLLRDVMAVVLGPRSAALLSYLHGHGQNTIRAMREVIDAINDDAKGIRNGTAQVGIMLCDGCLLLVRVDRLKDRAMPRGISFVRAPSSKSTVVTPRWMTEKEQMALEESLNEIVACLESQWIPEDGMDLDDCLSQQHNIVLGLDGAPCPPTLYGWMLGYPVTYCVESQEHASQVSTCLSSDGLILYTFQARLNVVGMNDIPEDFDTLMSFSIPQSIHGGIEDHIMRWEKDMIRECQISLKVGGWSSPRLTQTTQHMGGCVVL